MGTTLLLGPVFGETQANQAQLAPEAQTVTLVDCDGSTYTVPLANTDASVVSDLLTQSIVTGDSNGMGSLIIDMANTKKNRLEAALKSAKTGAQSPLGDTLKASKCALDQQDVNTEAIFTRFGEPVPITGQGVTDDEPRARRNVFVSTASKLLRRGQQRFVKKPAAVRMFHSDQLDVQIEDILPENKRGNLHLFQGDMVYPKQFVEKAQVQASSGVQDTVTWSPWSLWPNGQINYYMDSASPVDQCANATFRTAASMLEKYTCLRFRENVLPVGGVKSVKLTSDGTTCWAYVGMSDQSQVNLGGPGCQIPGIALHELGHAIGLIHQQSRANRDTYVTVEWPNIKEAAVDNFKKILSGSTYDTVVATKPYDYVCKPLSFQ
jgi:hypothetical protein